MNFGSTTAKRDIPMYAELFSLKAIDDVLDTPGRSDIRLDKESRILAVSCLRSCGGGQRGTAQRKAVYNRFPYTLRDELDPRRATL